MSFYLLRRATKFCARRARHNCVITLPACGSMLTLGVFRREHIFLGFGSLVLSGADIPYACFDPLQRSGGSKDWRFSIVSGAANHTGGLYFFVGFAFVAVARFLWHRVNIR